MFKFFDFLVDIVNTVWRFVSGGIDFLLRFFGFMASGTQFIFSIILDSPPFAIGFILIIIVISIVSLLLGHFIDW